MGKLREQERYSIYPILKIEAIIEHHADKFVLLRGSGDIIEVTHIFQERNIIRQQGVSGIHPRTTCAAWSQYMVAYFDSHIIL